MCRSSAKGDTASNNITSTDNVCIKIQTAKESSGSCRCAIVGVPWRLGSLGILSTCLKRRLEDKITPGHAC